MSFQNREPDDGWSPFYLVLVFGLCVLAGLTVGSLILVVCGR